ncbi:single-stranded DNA-binding protein [Candidatus Daviesbacteria bacterium]|nr:single-stranded DNA-binding protein [Candidatus Daviesbacteria bacterium]
MASRSWNRVELIGNLTRDPELRYTPNGAAVCTFGLATNRTYVSEGERKEEVDFHRLVAWNKLAELCNQLLKKGHKVFISGRLQTRSWEGADGVQRQTTEIVVEDMIVLTPRANGEMTVAAEVYAEGSKAAEKEPKAQKDDDQQEQAEAKDSAPKTELKEKENAQSEAKKETPPQEEVKDDLPF